MAFLDQHKCLEHSATLLLGASLFVVLIGGVVEIVPLFYLENTIEEVEGVRPYSPLELAGRDIYIREGCYTCHSQMIRPMRDEVERSLPGSTNLGGPDARPPFFRQPMVAPTPRRRARSARATQTASAVQVTM